ncbi:MAG TPA: winged helix-turn-helix domain-containing protein [Vicinamibacterales bacterium]|nr:winged helix-turn-helix domain-containing protein [Vicinamibacterales bacterium]
MALVRFDCYEVDVAAGQLRKHGRRVRLRDQPWQVLAMLLEHPGEVVAREDLQRRLWPHDVIVDFENNLNTAIGRLREALGDSADRPRFIETLPRRGYRFVGTVCQSTDAVPHARLLVLPLVTTSADPAQDCFCDAITAEIIAELSALAPSQLAVIARTTAMHYKGTHKNIARLARNLRLDYVVEGSVRRTGDCVTLLVQLVRAADETHVFARRFQGPVSEIFALERAVVDAIGDQLGVAVGDQSGKHGAAGRRLHKKPTHDLVAYNSYIQGRSHLDRGESPESWNKARAFLEAAIARDPQFALAYDGLAELWWTAGFFGFISPREALSIGIVHALRAVEIDNDLAEAHALLAQYVKQLAYDWAAVEREMTLALQLNPNSPIVRMRYATTRLMPFGRLDEAVLELERSIELDPLAMFPRLWLAVMLGLSRQYDRAINQGRLVLEIAPGHFLGHFTIGTVYYEAGMYSEAIEALRQAADLAGGAPLMLGWLGLALADSGDRDGARAIVAQLCAMPPTVYVPPTSFAWIHLGLDEIDEFFTRMNQAIDERDHLIMAIKTYPFLERIRRDPRYSGLLRRMNLGCDLLPPGTSRLPQETE